MNPITRLLNKSRRAISVIMALMLVMSTKVYASYLWNGLELTPSGSIQEGYDSNVTDVKHDAISDAVTKLIAGLDIKQEGKTESLSLDAKIEEDIFAQHSKFDNTSEYLNLLYNQELSRYDSIKISDVFSHSEQPTSLSSAFGSTSGFYFTYQNTLEFTYHRDLSEQLAANFRYINDFFDNTLAGSSNSVLNRVGAGLEYAFDSATILKTDYDYYNREFYPGSSATENELSMGLRRYLTPQIYAEIHSGADFINSFNGRNYIQPLYRASLTNELDATTTTGISFEKAYTTTGWTQDLFNAWRISANYAKELTSRISAFINIFYGSGRYIVTDNRSKYTGASVGASYELTKKMKVTLTYNFYKNDSNVPTDSYGKHTVFLGITVEF